MINLRRKKFKFKKFTYYTFFFIKQMIFNHKKRNLFISTGYFGTLMASIIAKDYKESENYLLITIDRQSQKSNINWAMQINPNWKKIDIIKHKDYYEIEDFNFSHKWKNIFFNNIFSNHIENLSSVHNFFFSKEFNVYEEGLSTYLAYIKNYNQKLYKKIYFSNPQNIKKINNEIKVIDKIKIINTLNSIKNKYPIKKLNNKNNIIYIMPGLQPNETKNEYYNFHLNKILTLENNGYNVYVAPHPRVKLEISKKINLIDNLPLIDLFILENKDKILYIYGQYSSLLTYCEDWYNIKPKIIKQTVSNNYQKELKSLQDSYLITND